MNSSLAADDLPHLIEYLRDSTAVVVARLTTDGAVRDANRGFRRLAGCAEPVNTSWNAAALFLQPSFAQLLDDSTRLPGPCVYEGLLNFGQPGAVALSLKGRVYWRHGELLIVAEYDVAEEAELRRAVLSLNDELAQAQRQLVQELHARRRAEAALREQREWLQVTLTSIGDAVLATDLQGCVTFLNPEAERLTGWRSQEAAGHPAQRVLRIFHEKTREPAEDPIAAVLRDGVAVNLANHTCLVAKDGSENPIDDRAAPIRDEQGQVIGVVVVFRAIAERRQLEETLNRRAEELSELNRRKDAFLAQLGHELRNPLAPIANAVQVLGMRGGEASTVAWAREVLQRQVTHLASLVGDLLDVGRISSGKVRLDQGRLDLVRLARNTIEDQRGVLEAAGLTLTVDLPDQPVWVRGDPTRLSQVLRNLLANAGKFTDPGQQVLVALSMETAAERAALVVRDSGIGIEADMLPRLFDPFAQAERGIERSRGGLGLGLALVKGLVELHGGDVQAHSDGPGRGAAFTVHLPLDPEAVALDGISSSPRPVRTALRLVVIEDNRDSADSLAMLLGAFGHEVQTAYTGREGLETTQRFLPDVVLCDLSLPDMDGLSIARALRAETATAGMRLIATTGFGSDADQRRCLEAGFDAHLIKPIDLAELQGLLAEASAASG